MASFRILNQAPQYLLPNGKVNAGGKLHFYETDLTTPKNTWSAEDLNPGSLNSNPVVMDAAGRTLTDVWGDGEYGVVMTDAADVPIWTRNNVRSDAGAGTEIPALQAGLFLTNDGSLLQWQAIVLLPDLTGTNGNILYSDGELPYWAPPPETPEPPTPDIVITGNSAAGSFRAGTSESIVKYLRQWGTDTAPANPGAKVTTKDVTYPVAFTEAVHPFITMNGSGFTNVGSYPDFGVTSFSANGFTVKFDSQRGEGNSDMNISSAIPFFWTVEGMINVP